MPSTHIPKKIAVLISGSGSNLQAIIDHQKVHSNLYEIALVISNRPNAYGLIRAQNENIKTLTVDHKKYKSREEFDEVLQEEIDSAQIDLIVLAGFMRILTTQFTQHFLEYPLSSSRLVASFDAGRYFTYTL